MALLHLVVQMTCSLAKSTRLSLTRRKKRSETEVFDFPFLLEYNISRHLKTFFSEHMRIYAEFNSQ